MDAHQLRTLIIRPTLIAIGKHSAAAENLMMGTAAQESDLGFYVKQINGHALSMFQIEKITFDDIFFRYLENRFEDRERIIEYCNFAQEPRFGDLVDNIRLAVIIARYKYWMIPEPLPEEDDLAGLASYWNRYYNTNPKYGTDEDFIENYDSFIGEG